MKNPVVIVGAGLSGLRAASILTAQGIKCRIFEARDRIGGRILSNSDPKNKGSDTFDLGPTWFWPQYERTIDNLVNELNLETFDQYTKGTMLVERVPNKAPERYSLPESSGVRSEERRVGKEGGSQCGASQEDREPKEARGYDS